MPKRAIRSVPSQHDDVPILEGTKLLRLREKGLKAWNEYRGSTKVRPSLARMQVTLAKRVDFTGYDLSAARLSGSDLSGINFTGADLRRVNARISRFDHCKFNGADLTEGWLYDLQFFFCEFDNAN